MLETTARPAASGFSRKNSLYGEILASVSPSLLFWTTWKLKRAQIICTVLHFVGVSEKVCECV